MKLNLYDAGIRKRILVGASCILLLIVTLLMFRQDGAPETANRPRLALMTSLPLQWSEGGIEADLAADAKPHPAFAQLKQQFDIYPIDDLDQIDRKPASLLLLAQPRAMGPTELVKLDTWVRAGGRVLIFADPALQWGSLYPLGDKRRPLFTSLLSPLFTHWGLELVLPLTDEEPVVLREFDGLTIRTQTPGEWLERKGSSNTICTIAPTKLLADCKVGDGRALLVADADLLDTVYWEGRGVRALTGKDEFANLAWVSGLLFTLRDGRK
jgi:hypothetical protein